MSFGQGLYYGAKAANEMLPDEKVTQWKAERAGQEAYDNPEGNSEAPLRGTSGNGEEGLEDLILKDSGGNFNALTYGGPKKEAPLTKMTLRQVDQLQEQMKRDGYASTAVGGGQFIRGTLQKAVQEMGLDPDKTVFDENTQRGIVRHLMKKRGLDDYLAGKMDAKSFAYNLAQEWAILKRPDGRGHYDGVNGNRATIDAKRVMTAAEREKAKHKPTVQMATGGAIPTGESLRQQANEQNAAINASAQGNRFENTRVNMRGLGGMEREERAPAAIPMEAGTPLPGFYYKQSRMLGVELPEGSTYEHVRSGLPMDQWQFPEVAEPLPAPGGGNHRPPLDGKPIQRFAEGGRAGSGPQGGYSASGAGVGALRALAEFFGLMKEEALKGVPPEETAQRHGVDLRNIPTVEEGQVDPSAPQIDRRGNYQNQPYGLGLGTTPPSPTMRDGMPELGRRASGIDANETMSESDIDYQAGASMRREQLAGLDTETPLYQGDIDRARTTQQRTADLATTNGSWDRGYTAHPGHPSPQSRPDPNPGHPSPPAAPGRSTMGYGTVDTGMQGVSVDQTRGPQAPAPAMGGYSPPAPQRDAAIPAGPQFDQMGNPIHNGNPTAPAPATGYGPHGLPGTDRAGIAAAGGLSPDGLGPTTPNPTTSPTYSFDERDMGYTPSKEAWDADYAARQGELRSAPITPEVTSPAPVTRGLDPISEAPAAGRSASANAPGSGGYASRSSPPSAAAPQGPAYDNVTSTQPVSKQEVSQMRAAELAGIARDNYNALATATIGTPPGSPALAAAASAYAGAQARAAGLGVANQHAAPPDYAYDDFDTSIPGLMESIVSPTTPVTRGLDPVTETPATPASAIPDAISPDMNFGRSDLGSTQRGASLTDALGDIGEKSGFSTSTSSPARPGDGFTNTFGDFSAFGAMTTNGQVSPMTPEAPLTGETKAYGAPVEATEGPSIPSGAFSYGGINTATGIDAGLSTGPSASSGLQGSGPAPGTPDAMGSASDYGQNSNPVGTSSMGTAPSADPSAGMSDYSGGADPAGGSMSSGASATSGAEAATSSESSTSSAESSAASSEGSGGGDTSSASSSAEASSSSESATGGIGSDGPADGGYGAGESTGSDPDSSYAEGGVVVDPLGPNATRSDYRPGERAREMQRESNRAEGLGRGTPAIPEAPQPAEEPMVLRGVKPSSKDKAPVTQPGKPQAAAIPAAPQMAAQYGDNEDLRNPGREGTMIDAAQYGPRGDGVGGFGVDNGPRLVDRRAATQSVKLGAGFINSLLGNKGAAIDAPGSNPNRERDLQAFQNSSGAMSNEQRQQLDQVVDPRGQFTPGQRTIARMNAMVDFWMQKGDQKKASIAAASALMYAKKEASRAGMVAAEAYKDGDVATGNKAMEYAFNNGNLEGSTIKMGAPTQMGTPYSIYDVNGELTSEGVARVDQQLEIATSMVNGTAWLQQVSRMSQENAMTPYQRESLKQSAERIGMEREGNELRRRDLNQRDERLNQRDEQMQKQREGKDQKLDMKGVDKFVNERFADKDPARREAFANELGQFMQKHGIRNPEAALAKMREGQRAPSKVTEEATKPQTPPRQNNVDPAEVQKTIKQYGGQ